MKLKTIAEKLGTEEAHLAVLIATVIWFIGVIGIIIVAYMRLNNGR